MLFDNKKIYLSCILVCCMFSMMMPRASFAATARDEYCKAEACYKKLRHNPKKQKYRNNWLACIEKFEAIYWHNPSGPWAAAGLYMSGKLYQELYKRSFNKSHKKKAFDIYGRIIKLFPKSAYKRKAEYAMGNFFPKKSRKKASKKAMPKKNNAVAPTGSIEKEIKKLSRTQVPAKKNVKVAENKNAILMGLRFRSNPGYIPIVIDADKEVSYTHRLPKKDASMERINKKVDPNKANSLDARKDIAVLKKTEKMKTDDSRQHIEKPHKENQNSAKVTSVTSETPDNGIGASEQKMKNVVKKQKSSREDAKTSPGEKLTQMVKDDGKEDTSFYLKCLDTYNAKDWKGAIDNLTRLIKKYPNGRYTEKAYFILAKSYDHLNTESISAHYKEIKGHYEDAVSRFPSSEYVTDAMYSIGNLYFHIKNYSEALGYYNLVIKKDKGSILRIKAYMQKVRVLLLRHRKEDVLSALKELETITSEYPELPERIEARKLKAKILNEMNNFHRSLKILNELKKKDPENIYKHPEISLYLGYNYYQLGDNKKARENLYRFYNTCPEREINHLVLNQIGDTYRNEGLIEDAVKFYRMILERYPNTDGAIISKIRLAEQQEEINWMEKTRKEIGSPREIYENIVNTSNDNDEKNPLVQLSLLKLAITYQKDEEYKKSLKVLKDLQKKYLGTSLKKEMRHALLVIIKGILKQEIEGKKHINVINFYLKEKELFLIVNAPELFLLVARAFNNMNLEKTATEIFKKADSLLLDSEKAPDLLFFVGKHLFKIKQFKSALKRFDILIDKHPSDKYVSDAYRLKGSILLKQKKYKLAADTLSVALRYPVTKCKRAMLLIEKAKALTGSNSNEKALKAINEANGIKKDCEFPDYNIYQEIGDLYLNLGYAKKAVTFFNQAVDTATEKSDKISLKFKIAQCYLLLNKKEDSLALYNQILSLNDPFWSNLAQEKIKEINFNSDKISEMLNSGSKIGESIQ